jgi:hypothetical protein
MRSIFAPLGAAVLVLLGSSAAATTLTVVSDKPTYLVGETITLTITGDTEGAADAEILGQLTYEAALTSTVASSQTQHNSNVSGAWTLGALPIGDGFATVFNQIVDFSGFPRTVFEVQVATVTLVADAPGTVHVSWSSSPGFELDFFGINLGNLPSLQATSFEIVPEPALGVLLALGGVALASGARRRS